MFDAFAVIKANQRTFYDYRDGKKQGISARIIGELVIATLFSIILKGGSENFLLGLITFQSILVGFGFNVLFFIGSVQPIDLSQGSLEQQLRNGRLKSLTTEIFYNISYFLLTGVLCAVCALAFLLLESKKIDFDELFMILSKNLPNSLERKSDLLRCFYDRASIFVLYISSTAFYFILFESIYTFFRIIRRVRFLFERKMMSEP